MAIPVKTPTRTEVRRNTIARLMECIQSLHLQHWMTKSYAQHQALGGLYESLEDFLDTYVETLIGAQDRSVLAGINTLAVGGDIASILAKLEGILRDEVSRDVGEDETALLNIRDEALGAVQKTRYLLTLS
jgi:hypothetical protein